MSLGDIIANNPIVHAVGRITGCVDKKTDQLLPQSLCNQNRIRLNNFSDTLYDVFWPTNKQGKQTMQYTVSPQISVEANSPEEAVAKWRTEGKTITISVSPRAQSAPSAQGTGQSTSTVAGK